MATTTGSYHSGTESLSNLQPEHMTPLSKTGYLLSGIYLTIVGTIATIGNITVICVLFRYGTFRKRSINLLLINMAASDLGVSVTGYPLTTLSGYWGRWLFGDVGCKFYAFCVYTLSCSTITTHAVIACYRYIYIVKTDLRPKLTGNFTSMIIIFIWVYALFWTLTPFVGWSSYVYEPFGTSCSINWFGRSFNDISYMVACVIGVYLVQIIVMVYCYHHVAKKIRGIDPERTQEKDSGVNVFRKLRRREAKIDTHVTKMCFMMMISFIIVWTPYAVESLRVAHVDHISAFAAVIPTMFAKSSCMLNPIIFLSSSSKFRRDLRKMWSSPPSHESLRQEERNKTQPSLYVRHSDISSVYRNNTASVYYDKERIYIGEMRATSIQKEAELMRRDPEVLSIASSTSSDVHFVMRDSKKPKRALGPRGPEMFTASGYTNHASSTSESAGQSTSSGTKRTGFGSRKASRQYSVKSQSEETANSGEIFTLDGSGLEMMSLRRL
ncbi:rhodopsin, G0-coupled-like [Lytechinus pictus]|uniref:rhodopsin, G0-coupled-like n=1 Tax=Lytechinus pictus TaxID=7653 RepID=UPI0030B9E9C1